MPVTKAGHASDACFPTAEGSKRCLWCCRRGGAANRVTSALSTPSRCLGKIRWQRQQVAEWKYNSPTQSHHNAGGEEAVHISRICQTAQSRPYAWIAAVATSLQQSPNFCPGTTSNKRASAQFIIRRHRWTTSAMDNKTATGTARVRSRFKALKQRLTRRLMPVLPPRQAWGPPLYFRRVESLDLLRKVAASAVPKGFVGRPAKSVAQADGLHPSAPGRRATVSIQPLEWTEAGSIRRRTPSKSQQNRVWANSSTQRMGLSMALFFHFNPADLTAPLATRNAPTFAQVGNWRPVVSPGLKGEIFFSPTSGARAGLVSNPLGRLRQRAGVARRAAAGLAATNFPVGPPRTRSSISSCTMYATRVHRPGRHVPDLAAGQQCRSGICARSPRNRNRLLLCANASPVRAGGDTTHVIPAGGHCRWPPKTRFAK